MNVSAVSIKQHFTKHIKRAAVILPVITGVCYANNRYQDKDRYICCDSLITARGVDISKDFDIPSPQINIGKDTLNACIVVNLNKNVLYLYDEKGTPVKVYKVASGKESSPTPTGIRKIIDIEKYPYKTAEKETKRYRFPKEYGPKILILKPVNTKNNELLQNDGIYIHGTNNPSSIGKSVSRGCIRMDNDAITEVANYVKTGQYVKFMR